MNINFIQGVYIAEVLEGGSAQAAGLQNEDIILKINGKNVTSVPELRETIGRSKAGETLNVLINRKNKELEIPVKLRVKDNKY